MNIKKLVLSLTILSTFYGCAHHSHEIPAQHISPAVYTGLSCNEIYAEMHSIAARINDLAHSIDETADTDESQTAIGMILFWPALFALEGGDGLEASEYGRLNGEVNALEHTAVVKECDKAIAFAEQRRQQQEEYRLARHKEKQQQQSWDDL